MSRIIPALARFAAARSLRGDGRWLLLASRWLVGHALRVFVDAYYASLPARPVLLPPLVAPAPDAPAPTARLVYARIRTAIVRHPSAASTVLYAALVFTMDAMDYQANGDDRERARAALLVRGRLRDAGFRDGSSQTASISMAIEALVRGHVEAALAHLASMEAGKERITADA